MNSESETFNVGLARSGVRWAGTPTGLQQANYSLMRRSLLTSSSLAEYYGLYWETQQWPQDWKRPVFIHSQRKAMLKNVQTAAQLHSSHTPAK